MRTPTLTGILLIACIPAASAQQFTILPRVGFELSRTTVRYNNHPAFTPIAKQASPHLGLRMAYTASNGHGMFAGLATNRSGITYSFSNLATGMNDYKVSTGKLRTHFEGGYQFRTEPISLGKSGVSKKTSKASSQIKPPQNRCGRNYYSHHRPKSTPNNSTMPAKEKGWTLITHLTAGLALTSAINPNVNTSIQGGQSLYEYHAGNWNTAIISGAGFEFSKNEQRKLLISMNCLTGITNLGTSNITTTTNGKTTVTTLKSNVSGWNITAGIPLTLSKKKVAVKQRALEMPHHRKAGNESRGKCVQYQSRCRRVI
ncbi:MAG: hypothetical protein WKF89_01130 [Chitinophagaceae bacterium]